MRGGAANTPVSKPGDYAAKQEQREQLYEAYNMLHSLAQVRTVSPISVIHIRSGPFCGCQVEYRLTTGSEVRVSVQPTEATELGFYSLWRIFEAPGTIELCICASDRA